MARSHILLYCDPNLPRKAREWREFFRDYGIRVFAIPYPSGSVEADAKARLEADQGEILFLADEKTSLRAEATGAPAAMRHLELVRHVSEVTVYRRFADTSMETVTFQGSVPGYLDMRHAEKMPGWWDERFRMRDVGTSLADWERATGRKISARTFALSAISAAMLRRDPRDFQHFPLGATRTVDFSKLVLDDLAEHPFFGRQHVKDWGLFGAFATVRNMGVHFRAPRDARESVVWHPGMGGGAGTVQKSDAFHEATFLAHDCYHHLLPDLVCDGTPMTDEMRLVYMIWRMMSEAVTLVLADMVFVDAMRASGVDYDFAQRRAFPFYEATGFAGRPPAEADLYALLLANTHFALTGRDDRLRALLPQTEEADRALRTYTTWYGKFFRADLVWTDGNAREMQRNPELFAAWWELASPVNQANALGIQTIAACAAAAGIGSGMGIEDIILRIFDYAWTQRLRGPLFESIPRAKSTARRRRYAVARWMMGQLMLYAKYQFLPEMVTEGRLLADTLCQDREMTPEELDALRCFFEARVDSMQNRALIAPADAALYREIVPHFSPRFVAYKQGRMGESHAEAAARLLLQPQEDGESGAVVLICSPRGDILLQVKDMKHPKMKARGLRSLWGGSTEAGESPHEAMARELREEFANSELAQEVIDVARYVKAFRVPAVLWPGDYTCHVFEARLPQDTFDRLANQLRAPGAVLEGTAAVLPVEELAEVLAQGPDAFIASHDVIVKELMGAELSS